MDPRSDPFAAGSGGASYSSATAGALPPVEAVAIERLRPWPDNPRRIADARLEELKRALADDPRMMWVRPLLALPDGTVIAGNQRLRCARELGWTRIPVVTVDLDWTRAQVWALRDNNSWGEWDEQMLAELLAELGGEGVEVALAGFASSDLDRILGSLQPPKDPDAAPAPAAGEAKSKPGELYELGAHRLLCADATDPEAITSLTQGSTATALWTDPPYGISYVGKTAAALTIRNDDAQQLPQLLRAAFAAADSALAPSSPFYICAPAGPRGTEFRLALSDVGWQLHQSLVWVKHSPVLGHSDYHLQHEDVLYGWTPGRGRAGRGHHAGSRWYGDNRQTSVFFVDRPTRSTDHPTMKPVALITAMLQNSSRRGEIVLDPFAGSGSTLIACEQLGRRCFAVELDPVYCDVIRRRYQEFTDGR